MRYNDLVALLSTAVVTAECSRCSMRELSTGVDGMSDARRLCGRDGSVLGEPHRLQGSEAKPRVVFFFVPVDA